jgi:hypothetical protein
MSNIVQIRSNQLRSYATRALVVMAVAGSSLVLVPPADAVTWIIRNDGGQTGTRPGSDQPCEQAAGQGSGASAQRLDNGTCWIVLPEPVAEHINPNAVDPWDETP